MAPEYFPGRRVRRKRRRPNDEERLRRGPSASRGPSDGLSELQQSVGNRALQRALARRGGEVPRQADYRLIARRARNVSDSDKDKQGEEAETAGGQPKEAGRDTMHSLTGPEWAEQHPSSKELSDLDASFALRVRKYLDALRRAGATVEILATKRPRERTYMMYWAWRIAKQAFDPRRVPVMPRLDINWWHGEASRSVTAAQEMVEAFGINGLREPPALTSHHNEGKAIDLRISWAGDLKIRDGRGLERIITSVPRDETNMELKAVGSSYGIFHAIDVDKEKVHWSVDGR